MQVSTDIPKTGFKGLTSHFKDDFNAAISVALVALPLALGIALASDVPPMAGIIGAIIGGLVTSFFRSGHVSINGPGAGLIIVIAAGVDACGGYQYILAAIVFAGGIQMLLGLLRFGKIADYVPLSVVQGILAAIGLIIIAKQLHLAFGVHNITHSAVEAFTTLPESFLNLNPFILFIALIGIAIMIFYPKIDNKVIKAIPAALWVLIITIPASLLLNEIGFSGNTFLGEPIGIPDKFKIAIPDNIYDSITHPDFSKITELPFWVTVISITIIGTIESLVSVKAVDKLDDYKRKTDPNRDLFAVGLSTICSGMVGGLPVITVIIRSSVNINHQGKTKFSNFYHGLILLVLVLLIPDVLKQIPEAALAAILIFTGWRIASPAVYRSALRKGWEQLIILLSTMAFTLFNNLIWGIFGGIVTTALIHYGRTGLKFKAFANHVIRPFISVEKEKDGNIHVRFKGILNFINLFKVQRQLREFNSSEKLILDFTHAKLIDHSTLDYIHDFKQSHDNGNTTVELIGLDTHITSSNHPNALHVFRKPERYYFSSRQLQFDKYASSNGYQYFPEIRWENPKLSKFRVFSHSRVEYSFNNLKGDFQNGLQWTIYDVAYNIGYMLGTELNEITLIKVKFDFNLCSFCLRKENLVDTISDWIGKRDSNSENLNQLFDKYSLEYKNLTELDQFFSDDLTKYILENPLNIETHENEIIIYKKMRLLSFDEIQQLHNHAEIISQMILEDSFNTNQVY